jgi:outer membrane protein assembly factor BamE (lipoprotein component of BamABCDE complex)
MTTLTMLALLALTGCATTSNLASVSPEQATLTAQFQLAINQPGLTKDQVAILALAYTEAYQNLGNNYRTVTDSK